MVTKVSRAVAYFTGESLPLVAYRLARCNINADLLLALRLSCKETIPSCSPIKLAAAGLFTSQRLLHMLLIADN